MKEEINISVERLEIAEFDEGEIVREVGRITVLEALAEDSAFTGPSRSNMSTPTAADADDQ